MGEFNSTDACYAETWQRATNGGEPTGGIAHFGSDLIVPYIEINAPQLAKFSLTSNFFWIIVISTSLALILSFTKIRTLEGVGASRYGSLFLYILDRLSIIFNFLIKEISLY